MITAWRIVQARYAAGAFNGDGARLYGGRWNSPRVAMVYVAESRALAALEMVAHLDQAALLNTFVLIPCRFDARLVIALDRRRLPDCWRRNPAPAELAGIGDQWVQRAESAVLAVPSAIIDDETTFLLNPAHADFSKIKIGAPQAFDVDARLRE